MGLSKRKRHNDPDKPAPPDTGDEFISALSHELRTPLTSLGLAVGLITQLAERDEAVHSLAQNAGRQVWRLNDALETLTEVAVIREGRMTLKLTKLDLAQLIEHEVRRFKAQMGRKLDVRVTRTESLPGSWDSKRIAQAARKLLANAALYGMDRPIELEIFGLEGCACVSVRDRGIGIAPRDQERIFGLYERAVSADRYEGMGLGLYFARQVAWAHRGEIILESTPGDGSVFTLALPQDASGSLQ